MDQAAELITKGEHEKAIQLLEDNTLKNRMKNLKQQEKTEAEIVAMRGRTLDRLVAMTASSNDTLKSIGKAASLVKIGIATKTGAIEAYESMLTLGPAGPALGIAAAAAITAFGIEQARGVMALKDGGVVTGGIQGKDSVSAMLSPGEMVVPQRNFDEVINATRQSRGIGSGDGAMEIIVGFKDNAFEIIEEKIIERRQLGLTAV